LPIYEYEPDGFECLICTGRFEVLQAISDPKLEFCPTCGLEVRRVVSRASIKVGGRVNYEKAAKKGLTTWRRAGQNTWEKVAGEGVDVIQGTPEDIAAVQAEKKPPKKLDLDKDV
jgi:putative FmdB family regulatory protein